MALLAYPTTVFLRLRPGTKPPPVRLFEISRGWGFSVLALLSCHPPSSHAECYVSALLPPMPYPNLSIVVMIFVPFPFCIFVTIGVALQPFFFPSLRSWRSFAPLAIGASLSTSPAVPPPSSLGLESSPTPSFSFPSSYTHGKSASTSPR